MVSNEILVEQVFIKEKSSKYFFFFSNGRKRKNTLLFKNITRVLFFFIFVTVVDLRIKNLFQSRNITISSLARIFCIFSYARLPVVLEFKISHNCSSIRNLIIIIADVYIPVRNLI